jgi:2-methylisocitrate lyase-like PEP mutase family enzyme
MNTQLERADIFANLHIAGDPLIIYNAWDGGSAKTIASAGAKVIATGDHPVGFSHGYSNDNFADFTFDTYLVTIKEIALQAGDLPYSVDINNANNLSGDALKSRIRIILETGAVGVNYEDGPSSEGGLQPIEEQAARIQTIRSQADELGIPLFINARTNAFIDAAPEEHAGLLDEVIQRAAAYKAAGANGFFAPGLSDIELITKLCSSVDMPVNIIRLPGTPSAKELADVGVSRISYGPVPQMTMSAWLKDQATAALNGEQ